MGVTTTGSDKRGKEEYFEVSAKLGGHNDNQTSTNDKSKKHRRRQRRKMLPVRRLFEARREVFADGGTDFVPPPENVERLRAVLDDLQPEDLGLTADMPYFRRRMVDGPQTISYLHLHDCDKLSIGIFCFPPSGVIPLHDHPGMTFFSKLLFGTMHIKSYDWVVDDPSELSAGSTPICPPGDRLAKVQVDSEFTAPCNTSILYPTNGGNMHCFTGVTACAVLDVLGPPYSDTEGRHFDGVLVAEEDRGGYARLKETEKPEDFTVVGATYREARD